MVLKKGHVNVIAPERLRASGKVDKGAHPYAMTNFVQNHIEKTNCVGNRSSRHHVVIPVGVVQAIVVIVDFAVESGPDVGTGSKKINSGNFVGQAKAIQLVEIRARITGFLLERAFKEGSDVKKGDILFKIDPAQYDAARDAAAAKVAGSKATKLEAESQLARFVPLKKSGTITQAKLEEAMARVELVRAELAAAEAEA